MQYERVKGYVDTGQVGEGHVAKGGDNTTAWEELLPTLDLCFSCIQYALLIRRAAPSLLSVLAVASPFSLFLFFLFSLSSEPVSCDIAIASTSPRPHTGDIPSPPPSTLSPPPRHRNYCTNPMAATATTTSPLAGTPTTRCTCPHTRRRHTQATPLPSPSLFLAHLKKPQISHFPFFSPSFLTV